MLPVTKTFHKGKGVYIEFNFQFTWQQSLPRCLLDCQDTTSLQPKKRLLVMEEELFEICLDFKN